MIKENCWVWFKGAYREKGFWKGGFTCKRDEKPGVIIESPSYVTCRVPEWRISKIEPENLAEGPDIPNSEEWKLFF